MSVLEQRLYNVSAVVFSLCDTLLVCLWNALDSAAGSFPLRQSYRLGDELTDQSSRSIIASEIYSTIFRVLITDTYLWHLPTDLGIMTYFLLYSISSVWWKGFGLLGSSLQWPQELSTPHVFMSLSCFVVASTCARGQVPHTCYCIPCLLIFVIL